MELRKLRLIQVILPFIAAVMLLQGCSASHYMHSEEFVLASSVGSTTTEDDSDSDDIPEYTNYSRVDKAISVDAKQRFVFSGVREKNGKLVNSICAEPSPDALSAIVSGITLGGEKAGTALNLALSQAESAASIGLRTQSIQLLRDGMYRICEAYHSSALGVDEVEGLLKRYQDTMVAILAIESLTGTVQANQVILKGESKAEIGQEVDDASESLKNSLSEQFDAKKVLADAEEKVKPANEEKDIKKKELDVSKTSVVTEFSGLTGKSSHDDVVKKCDGKSLKTTQVTKCTEYKAKKGEFDKADKSAQEVSDKKESAQKTVKITDEVVQAQQTRFDAALSAGKTSAKSDGEFETVIQRNYVTDKTAEHIANAVTKIVDKSLLRNDVVETCLRLVEGKLKTDVRIRKLALEKERVDEGANKLLYEAGVLEYQADVLEAEAAVLEAEAGATRAEIKKAKAKLLKIKALADPAILELEAEIEAINVRYAMLLEANKAADASFNGLVCHDVIKAYAERFGRA